jgi:hypothetical protein
MDRYVWDAPTMSLRFGESTAPIMAVFLDCPGAATRLSAARRQIGLRERRCVEQNLLDELGKNPMGAVDGLS